MLVLSHSFCLGHFGKTARSDDFTRSCMEHQQYLRADFVMATRVRRLCSEVAIGITCTALPLVDAIQGQARSGTFNNTFRVV